MRVPEAAQLIADARARIEAERRDAEQALREQAAGLAVDIAGKLLARMAQGQPYDHLFFDKVMSTLAAMTPDKRATLRDEVRADGPVRVVTAAPLPQEHARHIEQRLAEALDGDVTITFADDADLIAGIEVHFPHTVLRHSWRDDLNRVMKELRSNGQNQ